MKVKVINLSVTSTPQQIAANGPTEGTVDSKHDGSSRLSPRQTAWVIDDALTAEFLEMVDRFRRSLALDTKRPTVKRRFFSSAKQCPAIREGLVAAVQSAISTSTSLILNYNSKTDELMAKKRNKLEVSGEGLQSNEQTPSDQTNKKDDPSNDTLQLHILAYMRFLEYDQVGGRLDPHTDGNKICEDTGRQSTHTMLLYLRDCDSGGETVLLEKDNPPRVVEAVQPLRGRILLFPHPTLHEGASTVDVPKLCLRAEISLMEGCVATSK